MNFLAVFDLTSDDNLFFREGFCSAQGAGYAVCPAGEKPVDPAQVEG